MGIGLILMVTGGALFAATVNRPTWLGGPARRYMADDSASAMVTRSALRSLGCYLVYAGAPFWLFGI